MVAEWAKVKFLVHLKLEDPSWISGLERPSFMPNLDRKVQGINSTATKIYLITIISQRGWNVSRLHNNVTCSEMI